MRKGERTRQRIMDVAEAAILAKGFGATSIDELVAESEVTRSGFFYHFRDKNELARELLRRSLVEDDKLLDEVFGRGRDLAEDPLDAFLIGLKLLAELFADLPNGHPGCLVATYAYQERLFDREVRELNRAFLLNWRARFRKILEEIAALHPPRDEVPLDDLADAVGCVIEGGIVLSKAVGDPKALARQMLVLRSYIKLLFKG